MAPVRVRQHVNPLSAAYQRPIELPDWSALYGKLERPLHVDIGCARGQFLLDIAQQQPDWNFLGLEIRETLVNQANGFRQALELTNLYFLFCNANVSLGEIAQTWPTRRLDRVSIQFPDPWFKKRHQKRRVVQPELVADLAEYLVPNGVVFLQSDIQEVAQEMCDRFSEHPAFQRSSENWLPENPLGVSTEREDWTLSRGDAVYRAIFTKVATQAV